jgi:acyl carrier protein
LTDTERRISRCVSGAIREVNALRAPDEQIAEDEATVLAGDGGALDSLGLVNLAVALDALVEGEFGQNIGLMGELLSAPDPTSFRTVGLLGNFVSARIAAEIG